MMTVKYAEHISDIALIYLHSVFMYKAILMQEL